MSSFTLQWHITHLCDLHCWHCYARRDRTLLAFLHSVRPRFANDPESQRAFDLLCSDTLTSLRREIEALRFTKAH